MGPVGAPHDAVGIGGDQRLGERNDIGVVRRGRGCAIGAGNLHIRLSAADEIEHVGKARLIRTQRGPSAGEMIEHDRDRYRRERVLERRDHLRVCIDLDVPVAVLDAIDAGLKTPSCGRRVVGAAGRQIEPDAAMTATPRASAPRAFMP